MVLSQSDKPEFLAAVLRFPISVGLAIRPPTPRAIMTNFTLRRLVPTWPKCQLVSSPPPTPQWHRGTSMGPVRAMWSLVCLAMAGIALPLAAWAQAGSINGRVTDEAGTLPLVGARVQVIGTALSAQRARTTCAWLRSDTPQGRRA
jgi:hypothetical protein